MGRPRYQSDKRWEDRDGEPPETVLPQDYVSLAYSDTNTIPGLLAGGIGYGGNTAIPETIDPKTGMKQEAHLA